MLAQSFAAPAGTPVYQHHSPSSTCRAAEKVRVLVVEEDILIRLARCQLLDRFGPFEARAADPAGAIEAAPPSSRKSFCWTVPR